MTVFAALYAYRTCSDVEAARDLLAVDTPTVSEIFIDRAIAIIVDAITERLGFSFDRR